MNNDPGKLAPVGILLAILLGVGIFVWKYLNPPTLVVPDKTVAVCKELGRLSVRTEGEHVFRGEIPPHKFVSPKEQRHVSAKLYFVPGLVDKWQKAFKSSIVWNLLPGVGDMVRESKIERAQVEISIDYELPETADGILLVFQADPNQLLDCDEGVLQVAHQAVQLREEDIGKSPSLLTKAKSYFSGTDPEAELQSALEELITQRLEETLRIKVNEVQVAGLSKTTLDSEDLLFEKRQTKGQVIAGTQN